MQDANYILGIHDGHNSGATLVRDGVVVASVNEERLSRVKNEVGYPRRSIEDCLRLGGIGADSLSAVVYASLFMHRHDYLTDLEPWYCVGLSQQRQDLSKPRDYQRLIFEERRNERIAEVVTHLGVPADRVHFTEHHLAHLAAAYYTAPNAQDGRPVLGLTCDGAGDSLSGSVSVCKGNALDRIAAIDRNASLGKIYSRVTMLMGMKPWEHEYKVMGLAPYCDPAYAERAMQPLKQLLKLSDDGLRFELAGELSTNYCYEFLRDAFERVRFDTIAAATQKFVEDMLVAWVRAAIRKTGLTDVVCGGGVFMNVKANMLIGQIPELTSLYVMPSGGDESLSIGAALHHYYQVSGVTDHRASVFSNLYLGGDYTEAQERAGLDLLNGAPVTITATDDPDAMVADLLAGNQIVARCRGRMEWGARSLGNRSILCSADDLRSVERLNATIKMRDFWMPFAPSFRAESAGRYFDDPKGLLPRFMTLAYPTKPETRDQLIAASHPRDHTIRPQYVEQTANPAYHRLLTMFEQKTGRGVFLNTSFNLHGEPIVYTPAEAVDVFLRSGLPHLALDRHVISKTAATV